MASLLVVRFVSFCRSSDQGERFKLLPLLEIGRQSAEFLGATQLVQSCFYIEIESNPQLVYLSVNPDVPCSRFVLIKIHQKYRKSEIMTVNRTVSLHHYSIPQNKFYVI